MGLRFEIHRHGELFVADVVRPGESLTLGPTRARVPTSALDETIALLSPATTRRRAGEAGGRGYRLQLAGPLAGEIIVRGRRLRIADGLICDPRPEPLTLGEGDAGRLELDAGLELRFEISGARRKLGAFNAPDWSLLTTVASVAVAAAFAVSALLDVPTRAPAQRAALARARLVRLAPIRPRPPRARPRRDSKGKRAVARGKRSTSRRGARPAASKRMRSKRRVTSASSRKRRRPSRLAPPPVADLARALAASTGAGQGSKPKARASRARRARSGLATRLGAPAFGSGDGKSLATVALPRSGRAPRLKLAALRPHRKRALALDSSAATARPAREAIARAVRRGSARIRNCFEREMLISGRAIQGRLLLRWRIDGRGRARGLRVTRDGVGRPRIRRCIIGVVRSLRFPACRGSRCRVVFPFELFVRS